MSDRKVILYIGNFVFPQENAAGKRVFSNCCILRDLGFDVICIGNNTIGADKMEPEDIVSFEGIDSYSFGYSNGMKRFQYRIYYSKILQLIKKLNIEDDIYAVFLYANLSISFFNMKIRAWARKKNIRCYADCADWFDPPKGDLLLYIWKKIDTDLQMKVFNRSVDGVVCISSFLSEYYHKMHTVVIPPLTTVSAPFQAMQRGEAKRKTTFVYAGSKFRSGKPVHPKYWKDRLDLMIRGFYEAKLKEKNIAFEFHIIGVTKDEFLNHLPDGMREEFVHMTNMLEQEVVYHDYMPHDQVEKMIADTDFSVLIRDRKRMTMVGFPTKVPESISCGTPVIYNDTSNIKDYIGNGRFGFLVNEQTFADTIISLINGSRTNIDEMKRNCAVHNPFAYSLFVEKMKAFLEVTK